MSLSGFRGGPRGGFWPKMGGVGPSINWQYQGRGKNGSFWGGGGSQIGGGGGKVGVGGQNRGVLVDFGGWTLN